MAKTGITKQGAENSAYKSLVWLGQPANIASKLTDMANKEAKPAPPAKPPSTVGYKQPPSKLASVLAAMQDAKPALPGETPTTFRDKQPASIFASALAVTQRTPTKQLTQKDKTADPILVTKHVFEEYLALFSTCDKRTRLKEKNYWHLAGRCPESNIPIYGTNLVFTDLAW